MLEEENYSFMFNQKTVNDTVLTFMDFVLKAYEPHLESSSTQVIVLWVTLYTFQLELHTQGKSPITHPGKNPYYTPREKPLFPHSKAGILELNTLVKLQSSSFRF